MTSITTQINPSDRAHRFLFHHGTRVGSILKSGGLYLLALERYETPASGFCRLADAKAHAADLLASGALRRRLDEVQAGGSAADPKALPAPYSTIDGFAECILDTDAEGGQALYDLIWDLIQQEHDAKQPALDASFKAAGGLARWDSFHQWNEQENGIQETYFDDCWDSFNDAQKRMIISQGEAL